MNIYSSYIFLSHLSYMFQFVIFTILKDILVLLAQNHLIFTMLLHTLCLLRHKMQNVCLEGLQYFYHH